MAAHRVLTRKIVRDLRRRSAQVAAIAVAVLLGVLLFVASYDSFRNLESSYQRTYSRLHFADFTASGGEGTRVAAAVRDAPGVARVSVRTQADVPMSIGGTKLLGRVIGTPGPDGVNEISVAAGRLPDPAHPDQVMVEHHAAQTFDLRPGSELRVFDGTTWHVLSASGIAWSPEYLWPARSRQEVLGDPHGFAVVFAPQDQLARLTGSAGTDQTLVEMNSTATRSERDQVERLLREAGAIDVGTRAEQPSNAALHEDLSGFSELAVAFPALFLVAAAVAEYVLITRLVLAERPIIGTMLAMGARRRTVVGHYVRYGVGIVVAGTVFGVLAGFVATSAVTAAYTRAVGIPDTVVDHRWSTAVIAVVLGLLTGAVAGLVPALAAARIAPAAAMRGDGTRPSPTGRFARVTARWHRLPVVARMTLRSLARGRRRTLATMTGTLLALVLILASVGMLTSMRSALNIQFGRVEREDATVITSMSSNEIAAQLRSFPGVTDVEPVALTPVTLAAGGRSYSTTLTGLVPDTTMHGFRSPDGTDTRLPDTGILVGAAAAKKLHVSVGDTLTVTPALGAAKSERLQGLLDEPLGTYAYASQATDLGGTGLHGCLLRFTSTADRDTVRAKVTDLPGVLAYSDTRAIQHQVNQFLGLFWVFIAAMLIFGTLLAFTVIYVTMTVNLAERTTELATLRAAGVPVRRLTASLAAENLTATLLAVPFGLTAGYLAAWTLLRTFTSDMFTFGLSLGIAAPILAVLAVSAAAAASQLPTARLVRRIDIAHVVRERAQ
ncbi:FtsX-like permease family protein [Nocardia sp. CDC160]|uniref:FtsX-like permease family protein n=1 Tax=Nocardia sp. CDC160 TaxID=3112166 RepID=UPI002DBAFB74|nr:FtsX-like permease family protein [Nocardia sp. CDC160]MEC3917967.1 FtsX-like permease family protein [Nocardia sp. CDC160]